MDVQDKTLFCRIIDLGIIGYSDAYKVQKDLVEKVVTGDSSCLVLCEHPSVLTLGKIADSSNVLLPGEELLKKKIEVVSIDRGGDVTLHSPGQLVVYPIFNLNEYKKDIRFYLNKLEQVAIDLLRCFDIVANRFSKRTGVWVGKNKIVSIGIGVKKWVTFHGMGINVNTDIELFSFIKPCGLEVNMTSIKEIKKVEIDMEHVKKETINCFSDNFSLSFI